METHLLSRMILIPPSDGMRVLAIFSLVLLCTLCNSTTVTAAQYGIVQERISGTVTDESGSPLPGVNVMKTTTVGTITDAEGRYSIEAAPGDVLTFSFIGYVSEKVTVGSSSVLDVQMKIDSRTLDEVVVVGYGTMRKSDLTGSTIHIDMSQTEGVPNTNLTQALSGHFPGVNSSSAAGPGSTGNLTIRGRTTLSASESPLIVVDGVIYNGSLANINVDDIESIDVLKDASAAAVYGSRSANGVLLINTKRGKTEKPLFQFNTYYGVQGITNTRRIDVMDAQQFALSRVYHSYQQTLRAWYQTGPTDGSSRPAPPDLQDRDLVATYLRTQEESDNYLSNKQTNWIDEVTRTAPIQNYNMSVSGQTGRTNYYLSAAYVQQEGVLLNDRFERQTLRANFENKISDWLTLGLNTSYSYVDNSGLPASLSRALLGSPLANIYTDQGTYTNNLAGDPYVRNPLEDVTVDNVDKDHNLNMTFIGRVEVPWIKGLSYDFNYYKGLYVSNENTYYASTHTFGLAQGGSGSKSHGLTNEWLMNNILTYKQTFNDNHRINLTVAYTREKREGEGSFLQAVGFGTELLRYHALEVGTTPTVNTSAWDEATEGFMARASYTFDDRYTTTATFRRDGYSGFGANNKYANFPSLGLGWLISEESFINIPWLDVLKLRVTYGLNGNQGIGAYSSLPRMATTNYVHGNSTAVGIFPNAMGNSGLRWESTATFNIGLDYDILGNRIAGEIDIYTSTSSDVLVRRTVPQPTGYSQVWDNVSELKNKGIELAINTVNVKNNDLDWTSRFVFSMNRNRITEIYEGVTQDIGNRWFVGEPINAHYDYQTNGIWQEEDLFNDNILSPYLPGDFRLVDMNNDDVIDNQDRSIIGYPDPNYRFGIYNSLGYKNFSLNIFLNSVQGGNGYYLDNPGEDASRAGGADRALRTNRIAYFDYWTPSNPVNDQPAMFYPYEGFHGMYFERSFVRLQEISLGYNLGKEALDRIGLNSLTVYLSGRNLYTWTKWPGIDPELVGDDIPMMRSVIAGLNFSF